MIKLFPDMRHDVQRPDFSIYMVFFDLLPMVREAHKNADLELLCRIYGFSEWCMEQKAKDLWNSAGVCFYEHLFDSHRSLWPEFVRWLSPRVVRDCRSLWEARLTVEEHAVVQQLLADVRKPLFYEARQWFESLESVKS